FGNRLPCTFASLRCASLRSAKDSSLSCHSRASSGEPSLLLAVNRPISVKPTAQNQRGRARRRTRRRLIIAESERPLNRSLSFHLQLGQGLLKLFDSSVGDLRAGKR